MRSRRISPDGKRFAYVSQARAGFEADLWVDRVRTSTGRTRSCPHEPGVGSRPSSRSPGSHARASASPARDDRREIATVVDQRGRNGDLQDRRYADLARRHGSSSSVAVVKGGVNDVGGRRSDGRGPRLPARGLRPPERGLHGQDRRLGPGPIDPPQRPTPVAKLDLHRAEGFSFKGAGGDEVHGWLVKPPGFDPAKKYPVLFLIHGGPQGAWHDEWVAPLELPDVRRARDMSSSAINPRGSTGYGQKFTDQISTDWNGKVYDDLMKGLDHALATYPFLDKDKVAPAGGSFGGYMVNWIAGHTDRFKCLISHAGIYDLTSMNTTTEELWFAEWEFGGTPWDKPGAAPHAVAQPLREGLQDAHAGHPRCPGFPRAGRPGAGHVHGLAASRACRAGMCGSPTRGTGS